MDYSSLPSYPPPLSPRSADAQPRRGRPLTPRQAQLLFDLAWLAGIVALFLWVGQIADALRRPPPPPSEPLPFQLVAERFSRVSGMMPADEVFALLGPQRFVEFREPEMDAIDAVVECHPDRYPGERYWAKWADPADPSRWIAVFISGGRVYHKLKRGV